MHKIIVSLAAFFLSAGFIAAQTTRGKITYERTVKLVFNFAGMDGLEQQMPKTKTDQYELIFDNHQSLWKIAPNGFSDDDANFESSNGAQIRMVVAGNNDVLFTDLKNKTSIERKEFLGKIFIVEDSLETLQWKIIGETKTILGMPCMKATAMKKSKKVNVDMDNGKMTRKEVEDTSHIEAWFTTVIPKSVGPGQYQGQLPGAILEMNINKGQQIYRAIGFDKDADLNEIKAPKGKKRYTAEAFKKERQKMMDEMNKNNQGGNRIIRFN